MKIKLHHIIPAVLFAATTFFSTDILAQPCSESGVAAAQSDSICNGSNTSLTLTGYIGGIQWQSFDGTVWNNEVGAGATTDNYIVNPIASIDYRAVVTDVGCDPDTSNIISVTVGVTAPTTTGDTRCGYGPVTVSAAGSGIRWYDAPTGGANVGSGPTLTTNISSTTTYYASASVGGGPPNPFTTTFAAGNGFDGNMFDITAINNVTIDSFAANLNAGAGTAEIWYRPGTHVGFTNSNVGWILAGTAAYTSTGNGAPGTSINVFVNVNIPAGQTYAFYVHGSGGIQYTDGTAVGNIFSQDANIQFMEGFGGAYFALTNSPRVFNGRIMYSAGCESSRTAAVATVTTAPSFTIAANPPALCQGQTSTISVTSSNPNYNYTWSPATGLSGTTGSSVTASPMSPITYTVIADDGICGFIDSVFMSVGPASVAGSAVISTDTICVGDIATLFLSGNTGNIQWQSFDGSNWVNETGTGSTTVQYVVSPSSNITYRAVVTSGGCDPDTTITLDLAVLSIVDPVTVGDTTCGPGVVDLSATGAGLMTWFTAPTGGSAVFSGPVYSPSITNNTTYYVEASAGATYLLGMPASLSTAQFTLAGNDWGIQFDVAAQATLESVRIYPGPTAGNVIINLRDAQGGAILNTITVPVGAGNGSTFATVGLGFTLNPGVAYRLELGTGSVACYYNSFGATYPYTSPGSPVTLTGSINPAFSAGTFYYFFYNWIVKEGCSSNRVPVTGVVIAPPVIPQVTVTITILTSNVPTGNQWYNNGVLIPGATGQTYDMTLSGSGTYTVVVTDPATGCTAESLPVVYTGIADELSSKGFITYPNPVSDKLYFELSEPLKKSGTVNIYNIVGELVETVSINGGSKYINFNHAAGTYHVEIVANDKVYRTKVLKM